ncbi:sensor histidine kinase [Thiorhodococcus fuscus]|uniref:histidine kinase n=1 Tax=Thiorhodococcus fuscus TaxID=527200 RepID=A0ABW4Y9G9_9GAMM
MDFSDILASSIHDIKNSLGMILNNLDDLIADPENHIKDPRQARLLQDEARRVNSNLIQLLTLYKLGHAELVVRVAEYNLEDFLDEMIADNQAVCNALDIQIEQSCAPDLTGYFDSELVRSVLDNAIGNARRYTKSRILLSADHENDGLVIRVEDDGAGFPARLIGQLDPTHPLKQEYEGVNRTKLGHYFSAQIASLHKTSDRQGYIQLKNGHELPGGCLELWLP